MQTSAFTDEDLKRLQMYPGSLIDVPALLARLEAAETLIMVGLFPSKLDNCGKEALKAWRKAAGKGSEDNLLKEK